LADGRVVVGETVEPGLGRIQTHGSPDAGICSSGNGRGGRAHHATSRRPWIWYGWSLAPAPTRLVREAPMSTSALQPSPARTAAQPAPLRPLATRDVWVAWWPLAVSWIFMGLELPAISAAMARMPLPTVSLAAYGGVVFPVS